MSSEKGPTPSSAPLGPLSPRPHFEVCKGVNGLDKIVLREPRGSSAEVLLWSDDFFFFFYSTFWFVILLKKFVFCHFGESRAFSIGFESHSLTIWSASIV